jgi:AcrR family transcriptional regulator
MPRVSSKEKYTVQVFEIFKVKGLTLNMEEIAQNLGITKKTLYNNFSSKQELIGTVVNYFYSELDNKIQQSIQKSTNAIESFFDIAEVISTEIGKCGTLLLKDISLYQACPTIFAFTDRMNFYSQLVIDNLNRGVEENLYRDNLNIDYTTLFYTSAIDQFYRWDGSFRFFENTSEYHFELVKHHLYSVVNSNGFKVLESYLNSIKERE